MSRNFRPMSTSMAGFSAGGAHPPERNLHPPEKDAPPVIICTPPEKVLKIVNAKVE